MTSRREQVVAFIRIRRPLPEIAAAMGITLGGVEGHAFHAVKAGELPADWRARFYPKPESPGNVGAYPETAAAGTAATPPAAAPFLLPTDDKAVTVWLASATFDRLAGMAWAARMEPGELCQTILERAARDGAGPPPSQAPRHEERAPADLDLTAEEINLEAPPAAAAVRAPRPTPRRGRPSEWTPEREARAAEMYRAGIGPTEAGRELGLSKSAMTRKWQRMGLKGRPSPRKPPPKPPSGVRPENAERDAEIARLAGGGISNAEIAARMGLRVRTVTATIARRRSDGMAIPNRPHGPRPISEDDETQPASGTRWPDWNGAERRWKIRDAAGRGLTVPEIMRELGAPNTSHIWTVVRRMGLAVAVVPPRESAKTAAAARWGRAKPERNQKIIALAKEGKPVAAIMAELSDGSTEPAVRSVIRDARRRGEAIPQPVRPAAIVSAAARHALAVQAASAREERMPTGGAWAEWSAGEKAAMVRAGAAEKKTAAEMARLCGTSRSAIIGAAHRYGITLPGTPFGVGGRRPKPAGERAVRQARPAKPRQPRPARTGNVAPRRAEKRPPAPPKLREVPLPPLPDLGTGLSAFGERSMFQCAAPDWPSDLSRAELSVRARDGELRCCGRPVDEGSSYCPSHYAQFHLARYAPDPHKLARAGSAVIN